jgi:hypothetical protein
MRAVFSALTLALGLWGAARAELVDVPGTNFNLDTASGLQWLDLATSQGLSFDAISGGAGGFLQAGWRFAAAAELNSLFASNLALQTTRTPYPGGDVTDYYAARQPDPTGSAMHLISVLGGPTDETPGVLVVARGLWDRAVPCVNGCSAHTWADIFVFNDGIGTASAALYGGGVVDSFGARDMGAFLVRGQPAPIPEPGQGPLLALGLLMLGAVSAWHRRA